MTDNVDLPRLSTSEELSGLLELSEQRPVMVFKHSTRCPISTFAQREVMSYLPAARERGVHCVMILVVEDRPVSLELAELLGVRHQSPQVILVRDGQAVWNDSHEGVTCAALEVAEGR
jgi:bacillithiol system protein YtxJ|tara:strand:- start:771 stop:1124 length:354 start_codon:yes stop_codon:yes gene_type:complete